MIRSLLLRNFKSHAETKVELGRITALAGPNGSGKTSLLEASQKVLGRRGDGTSQGEDLSLRRADDRPWRLDVRWTVDDQDRHVYFLSEGPGRLQAHDLADLSDDYGARFLRLDPRALGAPSYSAELPPEIADDGTGLASYLAYLMTSQPESVAAILEQIRRVLPFVTRLRARPAKIDREQMRTITIDGRTVQYADKLEVIGQELLVDVAGADSLPASQLSEGTLLVIGLLTLICGPDRPRLLLLDDLDRGLHPGAQRQLVRLLRDVLDHHEDLQVVLATHSPYVLDEMEASEVWILAADGNGATHARCLAHHPSAAEALQMLSTGEFHDAEGEAWVLTGPHGRQ